MPERVPKPATRVHACPAPAGRIAQKPKKGVPGPYRLFFYSFGCNEPMHVHAERDRLDCKFRLNPVVLASDNGFSPRGLNRIRTLVRDHEHRIRNA